MTRFARAKGSKASNERLPEEPTPWHVMKQQLEESSTSPKEKQQKTKSAKQLLKEKEDSLYYPTLDRTAKSDWAEFDEPSINKKLKNGKREVSSKRDDAPKKKTKLENNININTNENGVLKKAIKAKQNGSPAKSLDNPNKLSKKDKSGVQAVTAKKDKKKSKNIQQYSGNNHVLDIKNDVNKVNNVNKGKKGSKDPQNEVKQFSATLSKRQKRNMKHRNKTNSSITIENNEKNQNASTSTSGMFNVAGNDWGNSLKFGRSNKSEERNEEETNNKDNKYNELPNSPGKPFENRPFNKNRSFQQNNGGINKYNAPNNRFNNKLKVIKQRKPPKVRDDKEHARRKPTPGPSKILINGIEIEIVPYGGFPVTKEDAKRLKELREQMVMKGIPKSDIDAAMKLERRKAEKALARLRKNVCFHCRKAGHNLSDCPELGREEAATGICFKCGSTEHTHFECKVNKKEEFGYAMCFICREQGHIAKQCPDNPKGVYPQGGACKVCGDVTHLKKDCPDLMKQKEESTLTLDTIGESALESLNEDKVAEKMEIRSKPKTKVVKF